MEYKAKAPRTGTEETPKQFEARKRRLESTLPVRPLVLYTGATPWPEEGKKLKSLYGDNEPEEEDKTAFDNYEINALDVWHSTELPDDPCMATFAAPKNA